MADYIRALKLPVLTWILLDFVFVILSYVKGVADMFTPPVLALMALAFGVWGGNKIVQFKGNYADALFAGIILGVVCFVLCIVGFGIILGLGVSESIPVATFMGSLNLAGALIGGGYALTK